MPYLRFFEVAVMNVIKWAFDVGCVEEQRESTQCGIFMTTEC